MNAWSLKSDSLKQDRDLQQFNREADHIDSATSAHLKLLENLRKTAGADESQVVKRFEDFAATVAAQEDRVKAFVESSEALKRNGHPQETVFLKR